MRGLHGWIVAIVAVRVVSWAKLSASVNAGDIASGEPTASVPARDLLRELVEIDTTPANGCTRAAQAMAA